MTVEKIPVTARGLKLLEEERNTLKNEERPAIIAAISTARDLGDLSENAEYHSAREKQSFIEGRILELDDLIARSEVVDFTKFKDKTVRFGANVTLLNEETEEKKKYQIVGEQEANIEEGLLAYTAPIARAIIGKEEGDVVEIKTAKGSKEYSITKVSYK